MTKNTSRKAPRDGAGFFVVLLLRSALASLLGVAGGDFRALGEDVLFQVADVGGGIRVPG
ncbi:hypothetical protein ABWJ92_36205 [Streptomyces sp. NPDC000609]|uniref:hypothetical protein n=1 Tax=Streptomyces sp. NPDC000609 TaxID=3160957 RepID=UPI0033976FEE